MTRQDVQLSGLIGYTSERSLLPRFRGVISLGGDGREWPVVIFRLGLPFGEHSGPDP